VDLLISQDAGAASAEVLEHKRLEMNDLLWEHKWREAADAAIRLLLLREGLPDVADLLMTAGAN
jgi:hypothetical protein